MAALTTGEKNVQKRAAKRAFFVGSEYTFKAHHLARQFSPGLVHSFGNVPSGMSSQEKPSQKSTDQPNWHALKVYALHLFDLSWRLMGAMLGPLFVGLYIDSRRDNGQTFALIGFAIGMICGALVIRSVVAKLSKGGPA